MPESAISVATKGGAMMLDRDYEGLYDYLASQEIDKLGLPRDKFVNFMTKFVEPRLRGFNGVVETATETEDKLGATIIIRYSNPDGRSFPMPLQAQSAGKAGAKLVSLVANIYIALNYRDLPSGSVVPGGQERRKLWIARAKAEKDEMERLGIPGLYSLDNKYYSWDEWIDHNQDALAKN